MWTETVNSRISDSDIESHQRWQHVLDFGCPVAERGSMNPGPASVPVNPVFDVMP